MNQRASQGLLCFFSLIAILSGCAQDSVTPKSDSVLDKLQGEWVMTGTVGMKK